MLYGRLLFLSLLVLGSAPRWGQSWFKISRDQLTSLETNLSSLRQETAALRQLEATLNSQIESLRQESTNYQTLAADLGNQLEESRQTSTELQASLQKLEASRWTDLLTWGGVGVTAGVVLGFLLGSL